MAKAKDTRFRQLFDELAMILGGWHAVVPLIDADSFKIQEWRQGKSQPPQEVWRFLVVSYFMLMHLSFNYEQCSLRELALSPLPGRELSLLQLVKNQPEEVISTVVQLMHEGGHHG